MCLGSSVYCDDADLKNIPPLPQMTTYLYARFNHISHIQAGDFKGLSELYFGKRSWQGREDGQDTDMSSRAVKGKGAPILLNPIEFKVLEVASSSHKGTGAQEGKIYYAQGSISRMFQKPYLLGSGLDLPAPSLYGPDAIQRAVCCFFLLLLLTIFPA